MPPSLPELLDQRLSALPLGPLCLGFSGGLDSTVLLHALAALPAARQRGLRALHVDHGLHAEAANWSQQCVRSAAALQVECRIIRVQVDRGAGLGLEGAAREARRNAFAQALAGDELLVLAHHRDDQVETVLLRMLRQSGAAALAGMALWQPAAIAAGIWRPLLDRPRSELEDYAQAAALSWIEDPSNSDTALDRNFLRHRVLPLLRQRWPHADHAIAGAAELLAEEAGLLRRRSTEQLAALRGLDPRSLACAGLRDLDRAERAQVLRRWADQLGLPRPPRSVLARIETHLADPSPFELAWAQQRWFGYRDRLYWAGPTRRWHGPALDWDGRNTLVLPTGDVLRLDPPSETAQRWRVGPRCGGERIRLPGRGHSSALKQVLQDLGLPPWEREALPLLFDADERLLAAGDLVMDAGFDAWLRTQQIGLQWLRKTENLPEQALDR